MRKSLLPGNAGSRFLHILMLAMLSYFPAHSYGGPHGDIVGTSDNPTGEVVGYVDPFEPGPEPQWEETSVFVNVQWVGGKEIPAVIKGRTAYISVSGLFDFLKIKNTQSPTLDSVYGFFINQNAPFCIDKINNRIIYKEKVTEVSPDDIIQTETGLFLNEKYFNSIFGLECAFDFSNLTVKFKAKEDLPIMQEMRMESLHQNLNKLKGESEADTTIKRNYPLFRMGIVDWSLLTAQRSNGTKDLVAGIGLGAVIAGGEARANFIYDSRNGFDKRQQFYQWRYVNNDNKALRQVSLGRIYTQTTASIFDPIVGVQVTNAPTTYRRSMGTYRLSRTTSPNWTVELYVNNVLVDYTKADASGFFSFDVPLVYGNSTVTLRYYGLYGEQRTSEENISIPFNFLPRNELEYTVSAGFVQDSSYNRLGRAQVNYGLNRRITVGTGVEYLSSLLPGKQVMPFVNASMQLTNKLMLSGTYTHGVVGKGILTYCLPGAAQIELDYIKYAKDQKAIIYNYLEERRASLSIPFHIHNMGLVTRFTLNQIIATENSSYTTGEWMVSGSWQNVSANISTYLMSVGTYDPPRFDPYVYSNASLAVRFAKGFTLRPQAQYSYKDKQFISAKCELEKFVFKKGYANVFFERNFNSNFSGGGAGFRYDLSFARVGVIARNYNAISEITESASGSFIYDSKTNIHEFANRPSVGRAGITILAYLDINGNGTRDAGEPKVDGLKVAVKSGRIVYGKQDSVIRICDLEPYSNSFIDISENSFEHIGWQIKNKTMNVAVTPNQFRLIELPVAVMSEATGIVSLKNASGVNGQGRITVCFYDTDSTLVGCTTSEQDGYYSYLGLKPGRYTVRVNQQQLDNLHMSAYPENTSITVQPSRDGALLENIDFTIQPAGKKP
jgi:hypothetical protein